MFSLILPAEIPLHPDVGPAFSPVSLVGATLECVMAAVRIGLGRFWLLQQFAKVQEMLLGGAPLGEIRLLPFDDELLRRHVAGPVSWVVLVLSVGMIVTAVIFGRYTGAVDRIVIGWHRDRLRWKRVRWGSD